VKVEDGNEDNSNPTPRTFNFTVTPVDDPGFMAKTVNYQYHYPTTTANYPSASNGDFVVGNGVEITNIADDIGTIDIENDMIVIDFSKTTVGTLHPSTASK
jgi:hypothetical protein